MKSRMLLHVTQLFKPSVTIGTFIRFFACMDADMLDELMVAAKRLQALLTLVRFDFWSTGEFSGVHLHSGLMHEYLESQRNLLVFWTENFWMWRGSVVYVVLENGVTILKRLTNFWKWIFIYPSVHNTLILVSAKIFVPAILHLTCIWWRQVPISSSFPNQRGLSPTKTKNDHQRWKIDTTILRSDKYFLFVDLGSFISSFH